MIIVTRHIAKFKIRFMPKRPILGNHLKSFVEVIRVDDVHMSLPARRNVKTRAYWREYIVPLKNVLDDEGKDFWYSTYSSSYLSHLYSTTRSLVSTKISSGFDSR